MTTETTIAPFKKHVCPGKVKVWPRRGDEQILRDVFVTIELRAAKEGRHPELSITAVEGPLASGDCLGGCGQSRELDVKRYALGWDRAKVDKLRELWERWHLNNTNACDAAMMRDGWREMAGQPMLGYEFSLTSEAIDASRAAKARAETCLKDGETFTPTPEESEAACRSYSVVIWTHEGEDEPQPPSEHYKRSQYGYGHHLKGEAKHPERKTRGWLYEKDHPDGMLGKKHPESGNGYGSGWYGEEVPHDVLQWLLDLPECGELPGSWGR